MIRIVAVQPLEMSSLIQVDFHYVICGNRAEPGVAALAQLLQKGLMIWASSWISMSSSAWLIFAEGIYLAGFPIPLCQR